MRTTMGFLVTLVLLLTGCSSSDVFSTGVDSTPLRLDGPVLATAVDGGLLLRAGETETFVPEAYGARWLPDGRALVVTSKNMAGTVQIWDPATGELGEMKHIDPNRSVTRILDLGDMPSAEKPYMLTAYDFDLEEVWSIELPMTDSRRDSLQRHYSSAHYIGGAAFLAWHDYSEIDYSGDAGVLRVEYAGGDPATARFSNTLVGDGVKSIWLSADGASVLALRRPRGRDCGGCSVELELVELDPATGEVVGDYGMPEEYEKNWHVMAIDKVDATVAVVFDRPVRGLLDDGDGGVPTMSKAKFPGTYLYAAGAWSKVPGSDQEISWWQGPGERVVGKVASASATGTTKLRYDWDSRDGRIGLTGLSEKYDPGTGLSTFGSVAGQLVEPVIR